MASFERQNQTGAIFIRLGKRDNEEAMDEALRAEGLVCEYSEDLFMLCYPETVNGCQKCYTDEELRELVKRASKKSAGK